jgi:hypothetical protein
VPDLSGLDLLGEWRKAADSLMSSAASVGKNAELPKQLIGPMQRQLELVQEVIERERKFQRQIAGTLLAPVDAIFDVLSESAVMLRKQAEALEAAGSALEETAGLVATQAELFEKAIGILREPTEVAKSAAGLERRPKGSPKGGGSKRKRSSSAGD